MRASSLVICLWLSVASSSAGGECAGPTCDAVEPDRAALLQSKVLVENGEALQEVKEVGAAGPKDEGEALAEDAESATKDRVKTSPETGNPPQMRPTQEAAQQRTDEEDETAEGIESAEEEDENEDGKDGAEEVTEEQYQELLFDEEEADEEEASLAEGEKRPRKCGKLCKARRKAKSAFKKACFTKKGGLSAVCKCRMGCGRKMFFWMKKCSAKKSKKACMSIWKKHYHGKCWKACGSKARLLEEAEEDIVENEDGYEAEKDDIADGSEEVTEEQYQEIFFDEEEADEDEASLADGEKRPRKCGKLCKAKGAFVKACFTKRGGLSAVCKCRMGCGRKMFFWMKKCSAKKSKKACWGIWKKHFKGKCWKACGSKARLLEEAEKETGENEDEYGADKDNEADGAEEVTEEEYQDIFFVEEEADDEEASLAVGEKKPKKCGKRCKAKGAFVRACFTKFGGLSAVCKCRMGCAHKMFFWMKKCSTKKSKKACHSEWKKNFGGKCWKACRS